MFGPRITTVFASRWKALWWSAGVLMTAYCSIPSDHHDSASDVKTAHQIEKLDPWGKKQSKPKHVNPWALKKDGQPG